MDVDVLKIFNESKDKIIVALLGAITWIWGKEWREKLANWVKEKLKTFFKNFARNWKKSWLVRVFNIIVYPTRTQIFKLLESVLYRYNIDRVMIIYPHNKTKNKSFEWLGGDMLSCYAEVHTAGIEPTYKRNQNILAETLSDMLHHLQNNGIIVIECITNVPEEFLFMKGVMISLGAKSAYINVYFDSNNKVAFILILGSEHKCVTIKDLSEMDSVGRQVAADFGIVKPKK